MESQTSEDLYLTEVYIGERKAKMIENVILITVDSLRADHLGCYGYHRKTTPYLDNIAQKGILFKQVFSNAPVTSTSFPSMLTSTYPLQYEFNIRLSPERIMISEVLKENGYLTGAFHCNPYLSSFYGYNRGFDVFKDFLFESYGARENIEGKDAHIFIKNTGKEIKNVLGEQNFIYKIIKRSYSSVMRKNRVKNSLEIETKYANAEAIKKALNALDKMGKEAIKKVKKNFSLERRERELVNILGEIV